MVKSEKIRLYKIRFDKFSRLELALLPYGLDLEDQSPARICTTNVEVGTSVAFVSPESRNFVKTVTLTIVYPYKIYIRN